MYNNTNHKKNLSLKVANFLVHNFTFIVSRLFKIFHYKSHPCIGTKINTSTCTDVLNIDNRKGLQQSMVRIVRTKTNKQHNTNLKKLDQKFDHLFLLFSCNSAIVWFHNIREFRRRAVVFDLNRF